MSSDLYPNLFKKLTRNPITIILLDGRRQSMIYDKTTKLSSLFEDTCSVCNLQSDNVFGFSTLMDDYYAFLNLDTKVCKINFKDIIRKVQNNVLFQSHFSYFSSVHKPLEDSRRLSQGSIGLRESRTISTGSTKSVPIYSVPSDEKDIPVLYFRVKSYVFTHCLRDKVSKSLYFLQLQRNVLDYKFKIVDEVYLQLGTLAIQAYYGDYDDILASSNDESHSATESSTTYSSALARLSRISTSTFDFSQEEVYAGRYFEPKKFFPSWIVDRYTPVYLFKEIPLLHRRLKGMSRVESEFSYIRLASSQYSNFNLHLFPVRDQKLSASHSSFPVPAIHFKQNGDKSTKIKLWLGLSPAGLEMHQMKQSEYIEHLSTLKWSDIHEVTHKSSRVSVHLGCRVMELETNTKMQADHVFWLTRHMHMYQTKARLNATCTAETLDNAERQRHREKYVYMDLEDLKLHDVQAPSLADSKQLHPFRDTVTASSEVRLPLVKTPAVPLRRVPSKAKPTKMKDLLRIANSEYNSSSQASSVCLEKHPQYVKKSRPSGYTNSYTPTIFKGLGSAATASILVKDSPLHAQSYLEDTEKSESGLNTSTTKENLNDEGGTVCRQQQFKESSSCGTCTKRQRHDSDTRINYTTNHYEQKADEVSVTLKSWKSDVLFDLSACLKYDGVKTVDLGVRHMGSYRDIISLSSLSASDNDHDSVEISSISSFELCDLKYSRRSMIGHLAPVAII